MFTLGIPLKQKRRTLGYLSNEYFPGGMKKLGQQVPYEIISTDREGGFFVISFPDMDEYEFRNITFQLKQQGVTVIGADTQLTEKTMKLVNLVPLNEGRINGPFTWKDYKTLLNIALKDDSALAFVGGSHIIESGFFISLEPDGLDPNDPESFFGLKEDGEKVEVRYDEVEFVETSTVDEGSCGYAPDGEDPNKADQPAGPHLLRKKIREIIETYVDDPNVPGVTGMEDAGGKVRDNILAAIPDSYGYQDLTQDIAYIIQEEYGSHNIKPFLQTLTQKLQTPNY